MFLEVANNKAIFQKTLEYLDGGSLQPLEEWVLLNLQGILNSGSEVEKSLAKLIEGSAIEIGEGIMAEGQLSAELREFVSTHRESLPDSWLGASNINMDWDLSIANRTETWNFVVGSPASPPLG